MHNQRFCVESYMRGVPHTILQSATLKEALHSMCLHQTNGLVVIDDLGQMQGVISTLDVIKHVIPSYLSQETRLTLFES